MLEDRKILPGEVTPMLPESEMGAVSGQDPETMEQLFNPNRTDPPQGMPPAGARTADASGNTPMPSQRPPMPEQAPGQQVGGLTNPDDTRYKDPQFIIMGNAIMGGMMPWAQAATDVAQGRVPMEDFDKARQEHERRIEELKEQHPDFTAAADKTVPFLTGLGMGALKPAKTVAGTMGRGAAASAPGGAARGYSSGPVEEPSASMDRGARALGGAATDAAIGAGGAAVPSLVQGAKSLVGKATSIVAERGARKAEAAASKKLDDEAKAVAATSEQKKAGTAAKAAETKRMKQLDKDFEKRTAAENDSITQAYQRHTSMPQGTSKFAEENRKHFIADPTHAFKQIAEKGMGLEGMSKALNLPASVIVSRMSGKKLMLDTPAEEKLFNEMLEADRVAREFTKRGLKVPEAAKPAAAAKSAAKTATPKATPTAKKPAAPKTKARSNARSDDNPYGEGPYTTPKARKKR